MTNLSYASLSQRFGGSALLVKGAYLFVAPLAITSSLLVNTTTFGVETFFWLAANVVSLAICGLWMLLFDKIIFASRRIKPIGFVWVLCFGLSLGALKGASTGIFAVVFELESDLIEAIVSRTTQTGFLGLCLVLGVTSIEVTRRRFQDERDALVAAKVGQQLAQGEPGSRDQGNDDIREFVQVAKAKLSRTRSETADQQNMRGAYSSSLRELVDNNLRPLSHRLWQIENARYANFSYADMSRLAIRGRQKFILQVAAIIFAGSWLSLLPAVGGASASIRSTVEALFVACVLWLTRLVQPNANRLAWFYFLVTNAVAAVAAVLGTGWLLGALPNLPSFGTTVVVFFWLCQLTYFTRLAAAALDSHRLIAADIAVMGNKASRRGPIAESQHLLLNRELANFLHSNLQNRLLSSAMKIERGDGDIAGLLAELDVVEKALDSANAEFSTRHSGDLRIRLAELRQRWTGFVDVKYFVDEPTREINGQLCDQFMQVLSEAVSNSIRHGLAATVDIEIAQTATGYKIEVIDDGLGLRNGATGLGSKLFDSVAGPSGWSLTARADGGTKLSLSMPL